MTPFTNQILRTLRQKERSTIHLHRPERVHAHGKPISRAMFWNISTSSLLPHLFHSTLHSTCHPISYIFIPLIYRADLWCSVRLAVVRKWGFGGAKVLFWAENFFTSRKPTHPLLFSKKWPTYRLLREKTCKIRDFRASETLISTYP